ncbi:MAG: Hsp70 family protein [Planctomycetota bacterium]
MAELILGIDLGTTNSEVAIIIDGKSVVLEDDAGDPILPSFVGLSEDGKLLVGKSARNQYPLAPERTIKSIKRKMGQDVSVRLGDRDYRPQEISAIILKALKELAEKRMGQPIAKAVVTVPAYFNDAQRQATREAGEIAGLEVVRILNEPTAASLTYQPKTDALQRILVYDLGGGTFDVSIVQAQDGVIEVLSSHGDTHLGGDDFDDLLLKHVFSKFQMEHGIDLSEQAVPRARLLRACEALKRTLSFHAFARIEEEFLAEKNGQALHMSLEVSRSEYEEMIRPSMMRTMDSVKSALDDAKLTPAQIDRVVLVGGSTRTPMVSELLEDRLGQAPHQEVNPDLCVAMGAAVQAGLIAGLDVSAVLVDITPHSLGIKTLGHGIYEGGFAYSRILHRNTPLPTSRSEVYVTVHDEQEKVDIEVFQGENDDLRFNHRIGQFMIEGLAKVPAGNKITVQFDLSLDGILKVSAREKATGLAKNVTIEGALKKFDESQVAAAQSRMAELWGDSFPGADDEFDDDDLAAGPASIPQIDLTVANAVPELVDAPREGQRESVQARALIEKAERLLTTIQPDDRAEVQKILDQLRNDMTDRRWDKVTAGSNQLSDLLFYLDDQ